ncbi:MAG: hypothetical protein AB7G35_05745 [Hyphomicrobiaceae bacterium]
MKFDGIARRPINLLINYVSDTVAGSSPRQAVVHLPTRRGPRMNIPQSMAKQSRLLPFENESLVGSVDARLEAASWKIKHY